MPEEVIYYVTRYGYIAIFVMVFLQEIGMPNPFPNELLLMFSGYLTFKKLLFFPYVILTAVTADFIGTNVLYFLFYYSGSAIMQKKPKWIPVSVNMMDNLSSRISKGGKLNIYFFRLTPFTRGYASVITGLLGVKPKAFLPIAFISALTWSTIYVLCGYIIGPSWDHFTGGIGNFKYLMIAVLALILVLVILLNWYRRYKKGKKGSEVEKIR